MTLGRAVLIFGITVLATVAAAQTAAPAWVRRYTGPGGGTNDATALALDANGNAFVTGYSWNGSNYDYATVGYSSSGSPLWTNLYDGPGHADDRAFAIGVDGAGRVFVAGTSVGAEMGYNYLTIAYSNGGTPLWTNRYIGPSDFDFVYALAVGGNGNVFVTGDSFPSVGPTIDYATVAYSNTGQKLWTNRYNGGGTPNNGARAIAVDNIGQVFVTGKGSSGGYYELATLAYSNIGAPIWTNRFRAGPFDNSYGTAIAVDNNGHVFVTGYNFYAAGYSTLAYSSAGVPLWTNRYGGASRPSAIAVPSNGSIFVTGFGRFNDTTNDYVTVGYSNGGAFLWSNRYNGPANGDDQAIAMAADKQGNVFVTGYSIGGSGYEYATLAYSVAGVPLWTNRYSGVGNGNNYARAIAVDSNGNVLVAGQSWNGSNYEYATIKYAMSVPLGLKIVKDQPVLSWTNAAFGWTNLNFTLQSAPAVTGTFTNIPGAASPYTNSITGGQQFFRLISN